MHKLVMFSSPTCAPCKPAKLIGKRAAEDAGVEFSVIDISEPGNLDEAQRLGVNATPTFVLMEDEFPLGGIVGISAHSELVNWITSVRLGSAPISDLLMWIGKIEKEYEGGHSAAKSLLFILRSQLEDGSWKLDIHTTSDKKDEVTA